MVYIYFFFFLFVCVHLIMDYRFVVRLILASKGRHSGSRYSSWVRVVGSSILIPWGPEGATNRGQALVMWCTVYSLPHGHHYESVAPILVRNEAVFAQPILRRFRRTQALREKSWLGGLLDGYSINSSMVLLLTHSLAQQSSICDSDSGLELQRLLLKWRSREVAQLLHQLGLVRVPGFFRKFEY